MKCEIHYETETDAMQAVIAEYGQRAADEINGIEVDVTDAASIGRYITVCNTALSNLMLAIGEALPK